MVLVLEILVQGPGKSWNFLMMCEADTMIQVQIYGFLWPRKIEKALSFREASPLTPPPHHAVFGQFVCYFSVTVINVYWSMDSVIPRKST